MLLAIDPGLVRMNRAEAGFTGELQEALEGMFAGGVKSISEKGAIVAVGASQEVAVAPSARFLRMANGRSVPMDPPRAARTVEIQR